MNLIGREEGTEVTRGKVIVMLKKPRADREKGVTVPRGGKEKKSQKGRAEMARAGPSPFIIRPKSASSRKQLGASSGGRGGGRISGKGEVLSQITTTMPAPEGNE